MHWLKTCFKNGMVDYQGFLKDKKQLQVYLDKLSANRPTSKWSKNEKMAFWINAYNAFTVKLILDHYPIKSIKDIKRGIPLLILFGISPLFQWGKIK